jgi:sulfur-carrier protein
MKTVLLPEQLRKLADDQSEVKVSANTVRELIAELESRYNGFDSRLINSSGRINNFVNIFINGEDIRFLEGMESLLKDNDEISIVPAVAGG